MRCLFSADDSKNCIACKKKGKVCEEQKREDFPLPAGKKTNLEGRVAKLEALLEAASARAPDSTNGNEFKESDGSPQTQDTNARSTPASSLSNGDASPEYRAGAESSYEPDPIKALFNNAIWQQKAPLDELRDDASRPHTETFFSSVQQRVAAKRFHVINLLRSSLVPSYLLKEILDVTADWWHGWRPMGPWPREITTAARYPTLQDFLLDAYRSDKPPVVGLAVLCIAVSISRLDNERHFDLIQQLPRPANELFQIYFERVDRLIITDSDFSSGIEGIQCMLMSAKLFESLGLPRKAWLVFGKAIVYGQQLGLHRPYNLPSETDEERDRRYKGWSNLCQADLYLSLLLGLPYTCDGRTIPASHYGEPGTTRWFAKQMGDVAKEIIDRNQMAKSADIDIAQKLQRDLDAAAHQMPPHHWRALESFQAQTITFMEMVDRFTSDFFYNQLRVFLHMPLMLLSIDKPSLGCHRLACLEGCRGVLRGYQMFMCECAIDISSIVDYSAFICASLLLLGILGYGASPANFQEIDQESDKQLVSTTLATLQRVSARSSNNIAAQALAGLQTLFSLASTAGRCPELDAGNKELYAKIMIPFFGEVTISPGEFLHNQAAVHTKPAPAARATFKLCRDPTVHSQDQAPNQAIGNNLQNLQIQEDPATQNQLPTEIASIDFDWNSLMNTSSEDWSWLADIDNNDMTKFL